MSEHDTDNTTELVCPYCGHETRDSWELSEGPNSHECSECEKVCWYETETVRYFTSRKSQCLNGGEHIWRKIHAGETYPDARYCTDCDKREFKPVCLKASGVEIPQGDK